MLSVPILWAKHDAGCAIISEIFRRQHYQIPDTCDPKCRRRWRSLDPSIAENYTPVNCTEEVLHAPPY